MNLKKWGLVGLGLAFAMAGSGPAAAQSATSTRVQLELSGTTYHKATCPHAVRPGFVRCFAHVVTDARGNIKTVQPHGKPNFSFQGYTATDLRNAYKLTTSGSGTYTVAIVDAYGYPNAEADLAVYRQTMGLPPCTTANGCFKKVDQRGGTTYPATDVGWDQEQALDLDMVSAACPNCHILLVQGDTASVADLGAAVNKAAALGANAISNSYGLAESSSLASFEAAYNHPGIAVTVSTGDSGYGTQFPANSRYVTAVGGTTLSKATNARGWSETAWSGAGSGCSSYVPKPTWQTDGLCNFRTVGDVSAVADPNTGARVYGPTSTTTTGWMIIGGTSLSAPFIAGVYGLNGGTANYGSDPYAHTSSLFDVVGGNNGRQCKGTYLCTAVTGYDGPTGLGTPNGASAF